MPPTASSSTTGFFQPPPTIPPCFPSSSPTTSSSSPLHRLLTLYLPLPIPTSLLTSLSTFSALTLSPTLLSHTTTAELSPPTLSSQTVFGTPNVLNPLKTSEGWRALKAIGQREGTVALGFEAEEPPESTASASTTDASAGSSSSRAGKKGKGGGKINPRVHQFIKLAIWQGSAAMVTCPAAMTDGAAVLLGRHLDLYSDSDSASDSNPSKRDKNPEINDKDKDTNTETETKTIQKQQVFREIRRRLISRDPEYAWTAGQWMTERMGGSDVRGTETVATLLPPRGKQEEEEEEEVDSIGLPLGPYSISGFKWFSSATDCDCAVLLAQTSLQKGLSVFIAPMRLAGGRLNGVRIIRLKEKMGTKPVPTAEVELSGMRGWMVGEEGEGIKEISAILNVTRLHTGCASVGYWGRGLGVCRGYAAVRRVKGGVLLGENAQHCAWMAGEVVRYRGALGLVMFGAALLGVSERGWGVVEGTVAGEVGLISTMNMDMGDVGLLLRVMTPLLKGQTTLAATAGLRACMESLGGIGYLENNETPELNLARLFRDSVVSSIWEGTTSVMAEDVMRVLKGKTGAQAMRVLSSWVYEVWTVCSKVFAEQEHTFKAAWVAFRAMIEEKEIDELLFMGREVLERLEGIVCALLLMVDAMQDRDEVAMEVARRWCRSRIGADPLEQAQDWRQVSQMDKKIFLGADTSVQISQSKL